tara:strand:+ start:44 stop:451 length:408 start_codon:yes stop_codon:yes gene_type:complete
MKTSEFKKILKPLIKQCIKEVIFEEGVLSGIITEVVRGTGAQKETIQANPPAIREEKQNFKKKLNETKQKMLDAIGRDSYGDVDLFEGTQPLNSAGSPTEGVSPSSPLSNFAAGDSGVDVDKIFGPLSDNWKKMI